MSMLSGRGEARYRTALWRLGSILTNPLPYVASHRFPSASSWILGRATQL